MTRLSKTVAALVLLVTAFGAGALTAISRGWGSQLVTVEVVNDSGQTIKSISLAYTTCGISGSIVDNDLLQNQSKKFYFAVCGEGGYSVEAAFSDGNLIKGSGGYVESGYSVSEVVSQSGITSNVHIFKP